MDGANPTEPTAHQAKPPRKPHTKPDDRARTERDEPRNPTTAERNPRRGSREQPGQTQRATDHTETGGNANQRGEKPGA